MNWALHKATTLNTTLTMANNSPSQQDIDQTGLDEQKNKMASELSTLQQN